MCLEIYIEILDVRGICISTEILKKRPHAQPALSYLSTCKWTIQEMQNNCAKWSVLSTVP